MFYIPKQGGPKTGAVNQEPPIPFVTIVKCYILASKNFQKYSKMDFIDFFPKSKLTKMKNIQ